MNYELSFIISSNVPETEHATVQKDILSYLEGAGAKVTKDAHSMGRRKLAYPIKKQKHGFYVFLEFVLEDKSALKKLDGQLKLNNNLLRYLVIKKDPAASKDAAKQAARRPVGTKKPEAGEAKKNIVAKPVAKAPATKIDLDDIDKKLDELLDQE